MEVLNSYLHHLAQTPERIDSLLMWTVCTLVAWAVLFKYREPILKGMEGTNMLFEGGEIVTFISIWNFPPILFSVAFFKTTSDSQLIALYIVSGIMAYQLTGRYIFDWALAIRTGGKINSESETKTTVEK